MELVERESMLRDLVDWARAAGTGAAGGCRLLTGEAGIGKTSVVRALAQRVPLRLLSGACEPLAAPRPLEPLHDISRTVGGELASAMAGDGSRHGQFTALLDALVDTPSLVVIEDVHWADDATLDLLVFLARRITGLPTALVLTCRDAEPNTPERVGAVLGHLAALPHTTRTCVPPLTLDGVRRLARNSALAADRDAEEVLRISGGNPFFVCELLAFGGEAVPTSVRDAVLGRVVALPGPAQRVLHTTALLPDHAELDLVYAVSGAQADALEACERAGLLHSDGRTAAFRHELARNAVAGAVPGARRQELHAAIAAFLIARPGHHEARISHHADLAGDADTTVRYALPAAAQSIRSGSYREACAQLARARTHLGAVEPRQGALVLERYADAHDRAGLLADAIAASAEALAVHRDLGDDDRLAAQLARHARLLWTLGDGAAARASVRDALALAQELPGSQGRLVALTISARLHMLAREVPQALADGEHAIALARERRDPAMLAAALNAVGSAWWFCDPDRAEPLLLESMAVARRAGDDAGVAAALSNLGSGAGEVRRYATARTWLEECRRWCAARDLDASRGYAEAWLARVALEQGEWDRAVELAAPLTASEPVISRIVGHTVLGRVRARRGEPGAAVELQQGWALADQTGDLQRLWPVAAGLAEAAWLVGNDSPTDLLGRVFELAVRLGQDWAVGELGWWLVRSGALGPDAPELAGAAAPYRALIGRHWSEAAARWRALGCPYDEALAQAESGDAATLPAAVATLHRLGARTDADRAARRLREVGGEAVRRPRRSTLSNPAGLTDRELEVIGLLAEGATNAEIGARLFISGKTVAHHVSAVLAKLGASSRREAGRIWAASTDTASRRS